MQHQKKIKMNQQNSYIIIGVLTILLILFVGFGRNVKLENKILKHQIEEATRVRDSIIDAEILKAQKDADFHHKKADSLRGYLKIFEKADSINHYKIKREKAKIPHYTPSERLSIADSILRSAGVQNGAR